MDGQGKMKYNDGSVYEGTFEKGLRNGEGTMVYHDKSKYVGRWKDDQKDG